MPIYEFQCVECKDIFEDLVPVGKRTQKCPKCGGKGKKLISTVGIIFKGSGWYCTDHRSPSGNGNGNGHSSKSKTSSETPAEPATVEKASPSKPKGKKSANSDGPKSSDD